MTTQWPQIRLGELVREEREQVGTVDGNGLPVLGVTNVEGVTQTGVEASDDKSKYLRLRPGRFVYNPYRINVGSLGLSSPSQDGICSPAYVVFAPTERIDPHFLYYYLKSARGNQLINFYGNRGTVRSALRYEDLCQIEVPLPPIVEQRGIVARIEDLATQINEARDLRQQAAEEAEALGASAVNALFTGDALNRWPTRPLEEVAEIRSGVTLGRRLTGRTIRLPYLRVANVQDGHLDLAEIKEVDVLESEADKWKLQRGDLLLTEGGDWDKLGRGTVWREEIPNCIHQNHIFRVRTRPDQFVPKFVAKLISSPVGKTYFQGASKQTTNLASINQRQLKAFMVFQPPLAEQRRIVAELDALQEKVDALKRLQVETAAELDALLPSILDKAFRGEL